MRADVADDLPVVRQPHRLLGAEIDRPLRRVGRAAARAIDDIGRARRPARGASRAIVAPAIVVGRAVDERIVARVEILRVGGQLRRARDEQAPFDLDPLEGRLADILGREDLAARRVGDDMADLLVVVAPVECLEIELEAIVEEAVLRPQRPGADPLGAEHAAIDRLEEAARLEAGLVARVEQVARRDVPVRRRAIGDAIERGALGLQSLIGAGRERGDRTIDERVEIGRRHDRRDRRRHRDRLRGRAARDIGREEAARTRAEPQRRCGKAIERLVLGGVARARGDAERRRDRIGQPPEHRHALGALVGDVRVHARLLVDIAAGDVVALVIVEQPGDVAQRMRLVRRDPRLEAGLLVLLDLADVETRRVGQVIELALAIGRDDGDRAGGRVELDRRRHAPIAVVEELWRRLRDHRAAEHLVDLTVDERLARGREETVAIVGIEPERRRAGAAAALAEIIGGEVDRQRVGRTQPEGNAATGILLIVGAVVHIGVVADIDARGAQRDILAERNVDRGIEPQRVVIAVFDIALGARSVEIGALGDDVDRAAGGVAAVERALRSLDHFDALEVVEEARGRARAADIDAVEIERDRRVRQRVAVEIADAAQIEQRVRARRGRDLERRDDRGQLGRARDAGAGERIARDGADRDRGALEIFRAALRGDDDVLQPGFGGGARLRLGGGRG